MSGGEVVPGERFEIPTKGLQNRSSTTELTRQINDLAPSRYFLGTKNVNPSDHHQPNFTGHSTCIAGMAARIALCPLWSHTGCGGYAVVMWSGLVAGARKRLVGWLVQSRSGRCALIGTHEFEQNAKTLGAYGGAN